MWTSANRYSTAEITVISTCLLRDPRDGHVVLHLAVYRRLLEWEPVRMARAIQYYTVSNDVWKGVSWLDKPISFKNG